MKKEIQVPKRSFVEDFILNELEKQSLSFTDLSPIAFQSNVKDSVLSELPMSGSSEAHVILSLSTNAPEILISGQIKVEMKYEKKILVEALWRASQVSNIQGKIQIRYSRASQELSLVLTDFKLENSNFQENENTMARVTSILSIGQLRKIAEINSNRMRDHLKSCFEAALQNKGFSFANTTSFRSVIPQQFNQQGEFIVQVSS